MEAELDRLGLPAPRSIERKTPEGPAWLPTYPGEQPPF